MASPLFDVGRALQAHDPLDGGAGGWLTITSIEVRGPIWLFIYWNLTKT